MYEVGVLGLGSMGSMALWQLARRGVRAIGFEQFTIGHDKGAAGGETRIFRTAYREGQAYVPLLRLAESGWRSLEADTGTALLDLNGVATIAEAGHPHVQSVVDCIAAFGLEADILEADEANRRFPAINVLPGEIAAVDWHGGLIKPERGIVAAVTHAEANGAVVVRRSPVTAIEPDATGVWVRTAGGDVRVAALIVTAGAWSGRFLNVHAPGLVTPHRLLLSWFLAKTPELFVPARLPVVNRFSRGVDFSVFSSQDANTVKAALNIDAGPIPTPDGMSRTVDPAEVARVSAIVAELYPGLWPDPIRSTSHTDGFTADLHAVVGAMPGLPNVVVAAGFSAHGFKLAPAIGSALADLATTGGTAMPIAHLAPSRHGLPGQKAAAGGDVHVPA